jgi:hypothetical protein
MKMDNQKLELINFMNHLGNEHIIDWDGLILEEIRLDMNEFFSSIDLLAQSITVTGIATFFSDNPFFITKFICLKDRSGYTLVHLHGMN